MMLFFLLNGFIQHRNADMQLEVQLCDHWFQAVLQTYLHSSRCRIRSWSFISLGCACNEVRMKIALYYVKK